MEIVEVYFDLGHTPTLKKWRHSYMEIVQAHFQLMHTFTKESGGIPIWKLWRHIFS